MRADAPKPLHHSDFHQSFGTLSVAESAQVLFFVRKELFHELWVIPAVLSESPSDGLPDKELLFVHSQSAVWHLGLVSN